jgi:hypothetical protein
MSSNDEGHVFALEATADTRTEEQAKNTTVDGCASMNELEESDMAIRAVHSRKKSCCRDRSKRRERYGKDMRNPMHEPQKKSGRSDSVSF